MFYWILVSIQRGIEEKPLKNYYFDHKSTRTQIVVHNNFWYTTR